MLNYENFVHRYNPRPRRLHKCPAAIAAPLKKTGGAERMLPLSRWRQFAVMRPFGGVLVLVAESTEMVREFTRPGVRRNVCRDPKPLTTNRICGAVDRKGHCPPGSQRGARGKNKLTEIVLQRLLSRRIRVPRGLFVRGQRNRFLGRSLNENVIVRRNACQPARREKTSLRKCYCNVL